MPLFALYVKSSDRRIRQLNYYWQAVLLNIWFFGLIIFFFAIYKLQLPIRACDNEAVKEFFIYNNSCKVEVRMCMYAFWLFAITCLVPIQMWIVETFKDYRDELLE